MIEGTFPAGRVDPIGVAPAEVVALAARCERLEAANERLRDALENVADGIEEYTGPVRQVAKLARTALAENES